MQTTEYHLYRTKFIKPAQANLFNPNITAQEIFESALSSKPSLELIKNSVWHIGNIERLTSTGGRFAIGRTTTTTIEKYDPNSGNFADHIDDSGPYTFVYFDSTIGLLGIGKRTKVAQNVKAIAKKIKKLFEKTDVVMQNHIDVRIDIIPDPETFLEKINSAYAIKRFKAHFTGPNPIDADELFQKPLSYYCQQLDAQEGSVVVNGEALNPAAVSAVAKSTAATANSASALVQTERNTRPISIALTGDARKVSTPFEADPLSILELIKDSYKEVRE